jgi:hypothetical protein
MKNSQLLNILAALSKKEQRELRKWLISPAHNQRSDVAQLYEYLSAPGRLEDDKGLEKERIFKKLYPKEAYNDAQMRQVIHFLRETLEKYFIFKKSEEDEILAQIYLTQSYRERKLSKLQERAMRDLIEQGQNLSFLNGETLEQLFLIEKEKSIQLSDKMRAETLNYQEMSDLAEMAFIARKLKLACLMLSHQRIYKKNYDLGLLEPILAYLQSKPEVLKTPFINIYYHIYNLYRSPQEEGHFYEVKQNLISYDHAFSENEKLDLYSIAINYCISRMNTGQQIFTREAFELYRRGLELRVLVESHTLSHLNFRNIVAIGTTLKEFEWVSSFIEEYQDYLAPEYKENFVQFAEAKLAFEKRDYNQAQRLLIHFDIDDMLINLSAKSMLIRIYYEEGELTTLESLLESMRTYINRKKSIAYHKLIYNNLIRFTKKLIRVPPRNKALKERLRKNIEDANPLPERKWLLEQLDKL